MKYLLIIFLLVSNLSALALPSKIKYLTKEMHPSGKRDDIRYGLTKFYYNYLQRLKSKVFIKNGYFVDYLGNKIDTYKDISCDSGLGISGNNSKYVMDCFGNIFINREGKQVKHSFFLSGKAVAAAGWMKIKNGRLIEVTDDSGHYRPNFINTGNLVVELFNRGLKIIRVKMIFSNYLEHKYLEITNKYEIDGICIQQIRAINFAI